MNTTEKYILSMIGLASVVLFCVSAANITSDPSELKRLFSEPISMVFQGVLLIGVGSIIKSRSN